MEPSRDKAGEPLDQPPGLAEAKAARRSDMKAKTNDIETIRQVNTVLVLNTLRKTDQRLTRPHMADKLGLSKVTISNIIRDTNEMGLTTDAGVARPDVRGGRKPLLVVLDQDKKRVLGARLDHLTVELVLSDITGRELKRLRTTPRNQDHLSLLTAMANDILVSTNTPRESVLGLVAAVGRSLADGLPATTEASSTAAARLGEALGLPVRLTTLPAARAFGECWSDFRQTVPDFFYVNLGHQLEGVLTRRGLLDPSPCDFADCYLAPIPYNQAPETPLTLKTALSGQFVLDQLAGRLGRPVDSRELNHLAAEGRAEARNLLERFGYDLGCALSLVVNIVNLRRIILGGFLAQSWPHFEASLRQGLERHVSPAIGADVSVRPIRPELANGLIGALGLALDQWVYHTDLLDRATLP